MKFRLKPFIFLSVPVALTITLSFILQVYVLSKPQVVAEWLSSFGPFAILAYIIIQIITIVIAPIGVGGAVQVAIIAILGPFLGLLLIYLVATPSYLINFYLARKYGIPLVEKVVGEASLKKFNQLAVDAGVVTLIILKVLQGGYFDYLSYAYGLTNIKFRTFLLVNFLGGIPAALLYYLIFSRLSSIVLSVAVVWGLTVVLAVIAAFMLRKLKNSKETEDS